MRVGAAYAGDGSVSSTFPPNVLEESMIVNESEDRREGRTRTVVPENGGQWSRQTLM